MKLLCLRSQRILLILAVTTNILMVIYLAYIQDEMFFTREAANAKCKNSSRVLNGVTLVIREYEDFENDVPNVVSELLTKFDDRTKVLIVADKLPYPPLVIEKSERVQMLAMETNLERTHDQSQLTSWIMSKFVFIIPDGVALRKSPDVFIAEFIRLTEATDNQNTKMVAYPIDTEESVQCLGLHVKLKHWTLQYYAASNHCDAISGKFVLGIKRDDLFQLTKPFAIPLQDGFFVQTSLKGWKVIISKSVFWKTNKQLYDQPHSSWKHLSKQSERRKSLFKDFGIKLVQKMDGEQEWFGCSKGSDRCFGTIHNNMPDFLYKGRWTPPCCLHAIRITARHVFRILEQHQVRYWLEGGSLLGAARYGDIIPWDYDVDIGIYKEDIEKSVQLMNALQESFEDEDGFVWERATEGDFFRVQYSSSNHLHVDIFPFYPKNGTMTKDTWFKTHRQDMPFPEHYLKPLVKIKFVGTEANAPNNWDKFLDLKFGEGVIDNPRYPDTSVAKY